MLLFSSSAQIFNPLLLARSQSINLYTSLIIPIKVSGILTLQLSVYLDGIIIGCGTVATIVLSLVLAQALSEAIRSRQIKAFFHFARHIV